MAKRIGVLTVGGDCPGSNAAIRGIGKTAQSNYGMEVIGFQDGFAGMAQDELVDLDTDTFSGILTSGGTILGTSREQPDQMKVNGVITDRTNDVVDVYRKHRLDALICLGGSDAQEGAYHLMQQGLNVMTLPLTIDNDLPFTDRSIGFDSAIEIAAEAIDRLHSTAYSHHRIIIVEMMGRTTGWLALGAGMAGGADVILIPEVAYDEEKIAQAIMERRQKGKRFSIIAVSEGALSKEYRNFFDNARRLNEKRRSGNQQQQVASRLNNIEHQVAGNTIHLANQLEKHTNLEARITILGYLQRGGTPSASDRVLATQLGSTCVDFIQQQQSGVMVTLHHAQVTSIPLGQVVGQSNLVPLNHPWLESARKVGTSLGE